MKKITCATCPHCIYESPFYWCGLERTENSDTDVSDGEFKPFNFQPDWCLLGRDTDDNK